MKNSKISPNIYATLLCLLLGFISTNAQNRQPQNVRRVIVTSRYEIKDGKRTSKSMAIKQEIKDSLDRVHTILNRDYETQTVMSHTWHTFEGKQVVRTDEFVNEKLRVTRLFTHTSDSLLATETIFRVNPGDTAFYVKLAYTYGQLRKPIQVDAVDVRGKRAYRSKSVYDSRGTEIKRTVKVKREFTPLDSVVSLTDAPAYDSAGRIISEVITKKYINGKTTVVSYRYGYNGKGLMSTVEEVYPSGSVKLRKTLEYNDKGMVKFISVYDSNSTLVEYYAKRYELYPTRDRRNQIIEY